MTTKDNEVTMTRSNNGMQATSREQTQSANAAAAASASAKPKSRKHQSTPEEVKSWADSKGLQPPK